MRVHIGLLIVFTLFILCRDGWGQDAGEVQISEGEYVPPHVQLERGGEVVLWDPDAVGPFTLVNQNGEEFTRESLLGKPWIANFVFTRCQLQCPATLRKMMELNELLKDVDVRFVTITVDPEHDTPELMKEYATIWQAEPERWIFATGEPDEVWRLIREGFKVSAWENVGTERVPGMEFAHDNHILHMNEDGRILGRYHSSVEWELNTLQRVLRGKIETPLKHQPAIIEAALASATTVEAEAKEDDPLAKLPRWAQRLPATNAMLNALATCMLLIGFTAIKAGNVRLHKKLMLYSFGVSVAFLVCYLLYHWALHQYAGIPGKPFNGTGSIRTLYFTILISHVILAAAVPVLTITTIVKALRANWESHRRWARVTFPVWLYVSITGVIIYGMLYHL